MDSKEQIISIDFNDREAPKQLVSSLHNTGFAVIMNHPIDYALVSKAFQDWNIFFESSQKFDYLFTKEVQDGYFPYKSENASGMSTKDLKEFFHIYPNGQYPDSMDLTTKELYGQLVNLGTILLKWIDNYTVNEISHSFSMPLHKMVTDSVTNLLRVIHYPPINKDEDAHSIRANPHADINLITLLVAGSEPGLQVQDSQGNWIDVTCDPGFIVINSGDMLKEASRGYYPSTIHRVVNPEGEKNNVSRFSMPMFIHPRDEVVLSNKYTAGSYLHERLTEIGLK